MIQYNYIVTFKHQEGMKTMNLEEIGMIVIVIIVLMFCLSEVGKGRMKND